MALNFPDSPTLNQEVELGGKTYRWDGVKWRMVYVVTPTAQSLAPTITEVSVTADSITFTITNNDTDSAVILYEVGDNTPDENSIELATSATSSNITISGLTGNTQYNVSATASVTGKVLSNVGSVTITTLQPPTYQGDRAIFGGGDTTGNGSETNVLDYINITTTSNATDFGDMHIGSGPAGVSNGSRGLFAGGFDFSVSVTNTIGYITISTLGNTTDFGDLTVSRGDASGISNSTRGIFGGGHNNNFTVYYDTIDFVTIATTGNAADFGNLTAPRALMSSTQDFTRGVFASGQRESTTSPNVFNQIQYITIDTVGNAFNFGDSTTTGQKGFGGGSNNTRGVFAGGSDGSNLNIIDYITIATLGNATDFGDLTVARRGNVSTSNTTRMVMAGGYISATTNIIDYITIATTGNATDFGDLTVARMQVGGLSGN